MGNWLTADQAADLLGVKRRSLYDYALRLPDFPQPSRIGRTVLWDRAGLVAWRKAHPARRR